MKTKTLLAALLSVKQALTTNGNLIEYNYVYFTGTHVIAYNSTICIQTECETEFEAFVNGADLIKLLQTIKSDTIKLVNIDGDLIITAPSLRIKLAVFESDTHLEILTQMHNASKDVEYIDLPDDFIENINACSEFYSKREFDTVLSCIKIENTTYTVSDSVRVFQLLNTEPMENMLVLGTEIKNINNIKPTHYSVADKWLYFKRDTTVLFLRQISGDFPEVDSLFKFSGTSLHVTKKLLYGIELAEIFTNTLTPAIELIIKNNKCSVCISGSSCATKYCTKVKYSGKPLTININPTFLKAMLKYSTKLFIAEDNTKIKLSAKNIRLLTAVYN